MEIVQLQSKLDEHGYIYIDYLGSGAFANCYIVQDKRYNNKFACKVINLQYCDNILQSVVRKYHIEVESLCSVCHPNIIKIYNYFYDESNLYVIVEYCSNGTLDNWIKTYGSICGRKLFLWVTQFAHALASCHDHELAHRDLKPANILFDDDFNIKICDFGLACIHEPISQKYCGNLRYAAPEIRHKKPYDPYKADVWSFGLIVAFMAMGPDAFAQWTEYLEYGSYIFPKELPQNLINLIRHCVITNPDQRWSMAEIVRYLHSSVKLQISPHKTNSMKFRGNSLIGPLSMSRLRIQPKQASTIILPSL